MSLVEQAHGLVAHVESLSGGEQVRTSCELMLDLCERYENGDQQAVWPLLQLLRRVEEWVERVSSEVADGEQPKVLRFDAVG